MRLALPVPSEHVEQRTLFRWAAAQYVAHPELRWLYAIPNGGLRSKATAGKLKAEGVKPGYPDIGLDLARAGFHGLRIELKRREGAQLRPGQSAWGRHLTEVGYYWTCRDGWEQARDALLWYLALPRPG